MHEMEWAHKILLGFKYTTNTVYSEDWDNVSLHARGIVFDYATGEVLARPFDKFFNLGEMINVETGELKPIAGYVKQHLGFDNLSGDYKHQKFRVMDKLDGSLGIAFWTGTDWYVKTAGSFESDQAKWANEWFDMIIDPSVLDKSKTYLFEIIYDEDKHPIEYDFEGLVLLGIVDTQSGIEEPLSEILRVAKELNIRHAEVLEFTDFDEVVKYAKNLPKTKEGVVITFENGFKLKVKGDEFLQLQKIFHYLNENVIYENLKWGTIFDYTELEYAYTDGFIMDIPEELEDLKEYADNLRKDFVFYLDLTVGYGKHLRNKYSDNRRAAYEYITSVLQGEFKKLVAAIMMYYTSGEINTKIRGAIYKALKP
jgi:RNA ligase